MLIAAAGNTGGYESAMYPAAYTNVIGVSGLTPTKEFAFHDKHPCQGAGGGSSWGPHVDLAAPFWARSTTAGNQYSGEEAGFCGTSMSAPHVAGVAALVMAFYPEWSNAQVVNQLLSTAEDLGVLGRDDYFGYGLVNAALAAPEPK